MRLSNLLKDCLPITLPFDTEITGITLDSRQVHPNDLFIALKGSQLDGRVYIEDAIQKGAAVILMDADHGSSAFQQEKIPYIFIPNLKDKLGLLASRFNDYPAKKLKMFGVTGTNGKTSCTHFLGQIFQPFCGVIGTLGSGMYGDLTETGLTTPDAVTLQATLKELLGKGAQAVAMEVSSHSIDQGRINSIAFESSIFTNLTQDHLDYHGSMENYAAVKRRFLAETPSKHTIINAEDPYGATWIKELSSKKSVFAYSTHSFNYPESHAIYAEKVELSLQGIRATVKTPWGSGELSLPLIGRFNLSNALAVLTAACLAGKPFDDVLKSLSQLKPVPGRMQTFAKPGLPLVVVDYSHTPDALQNALKALRPHTKGKLFCVFGCGGNRDPLKRPIMAKIAEELADQVIVTNDNPRHEKPEDIANQIQAGFSHPEFISLILDRSKAIEKSIQWAASTDCVLIAGKGAERYQQIGDEKVHFDDAEEVTKYMAEKMNVTMVK